MSKGLHTLAQLNSMYWKHLGKDQTVCPTCGLDPIELDREVKKLIEDITLSVIGEDDTTDGALADVNEINTYRNGLRQEQREALNDR